MDSLEQFFGNSFTGHMILSKFLAHMPDWADPNLVVNLLKDKAYMEYAFTYDLFKGTEACLDVVI